MRQTIMKTRTLVLLAALSLSLGQAPAQSVNITSATRSGLLTWTTPFTNSSITLLFSTNLNNRVWLPARHVFSTGLVVSTALTTPRPPVVFYRVQAQDISNVPTGMALIPAGAFQMGDNYSQGAATERPVHTVNISGFYMDRFEASNEQIRQVYQWAYDQGLLGATPATVTNRQGQSYELVDLDLKDHELPVTRLLFTNGLFSVPVGMANLPITGITWYGAQAYCNYRSDMEGLPRCINFTNWTCDFSQGGYRLPTEAEWEKGARGGLTGHHFPWASHGGNYLQHITPNQATFSGSINPYFNWYMTPGGFFNGQLQLKTAWNWPWVGESLQTADGVNGYGLYDMAGNAWEWCWDYWQGDWYSNPAASSDDTRGPVGPVWGRHIRGGGQGYYEDKMRCANRYNIPWAPEWASPVVGFRSVRKQ